MNVIIFFFLITDAHDRINLPMALKGLKLVTIEEQIQSQTN